ncbi:flavin monoamine oxidase family protein [Rhizosphaericola mali]|uniref:Tryptophan 2-monooxygenase n=1 Tax=Rhizosphaericola mali TaxID=2545455 RepID=A0A5P2G156_9BACT|nr:flavin monoamine oxidase family protein [Rhizosphaericola mali]QES89534.1 flavin monoamine oxidase family protein [Rhizosphaericola mali]
MTTRRDFLTKLGILTGGALPGMLSLGLLKAEAKLHELPPLDTKIPNGSKTVIILGAGLSGIVSAYELGKLGYKCILLEARGRVGGRVFSVRNGASSEEITNGVQTAHFDSGMYFNAGPSRVPHFHQVTLHYCKEFKIPMEVYNNVDEATYYYSEGNGPLSNKKIKKAALHNDMRGYTAELLAKAIDAKALDLPMTKEDGEKYLEYLRAEGALNMDDLYKGSSRRGYTSYPADGDHPGTVGEPFKLDQIISSGLLGSDFYGVAEYVYELQQTMLQMVGGNDALVKAMAKKVEQNIHLNSEVTNIENGDEKVTITYKDKVGTHKISGDFCISTIPLKVLSDISHNFASSYSRAIDKTEYIMAGKIGMQFKRRFWEEDEEIFGGITHTNNDLYQIFYPSNDYLSQKGMLIGYYNFNERAQKVGELSYADREKLAFEKGSLIHPQYATEYEKKSFSVSWHKTKYTLGGWGIYSEKERQTIYQTLLKPDRCTYFAGDNLTYLNGWMAGALESGRSVVNAIHSKVTQKNFELSK